MGPWTHGGWAVHDGHRLGSVDFAAETAAFYREQILLPFFEFHLKDAGELEHPGGVRVRDRHQRLARVRRLAAAGGEGADAVLPRGRAALASSHRPGPMTTPATPTSAIRPSRCRSWATRRSGCPRSTWSPTSGSRPRGPTSSSTSPSRWRTTCTLAGPVSPRLFVSTTGTDADWVVKLIDVYPPEPEQARAHVRR